MTLTATHLPVSVTRRAASARTDALAQVGLNWFAIVMGTGILANAAATLPLQLPGQRAAATGIWLLATVVLAALGLVWAVRMIRHRGQVRAERDHPVLAHFSGAPPMALLTVGAGAMLLGKDVIGEPTAVALDWVLWPLGTALGLATAVAVPYRMITRTPAGAPDAAFGGWLMPVVPPMVSAATGVLLLPHTPPGQARVTLLACCGAMFGLSLIAALITTTMIWSKLMHFGAPTAALVPTLWIVLGPLGQSVTAMRRNGRRSARRGRARAGRRIGAGRHRFRDRRLGFRDAVVDVGARGHRAHLPVGRARLLTHLVGFHLPAGYLRHREHRAVRAHRRGVVRRRGGRAVRAAGRRLVHGRAAHRARRPGRFAATSGRCGTGVIVPTGTAAHRAPVRCVSRRTPSQSPISVLAP